MRTLIVTHRSFALALVLTVIVNTSTAYYGNRYLTTEPDVPIPAIGVSTHKDKLVGKAKHCSVIRDPAHAGHTEVCHDLVGANGRHWGGFVFRVDRPIKITSFDFFGNGGRTVGPLRFQFRLWESPGKSHLNSKLMLNINTTLKYDPVKPEISKLMRIFPQEVIPVLKGGDKYQYTIEFKFWGPILFAKRTEGHYGTRVVNCTGNPVTFEFYESGDDGFGVWQLPVINFEMFEGVLAPEPEPSRNTFHMISVAL